MTCLLDMVGHFSYCVSAEKIGLLGRKKNDNYIFKMFCMGNFIVKLCNLVNKHQMEVLACFYSISNKHIYNYKMLFGSTGNITLITLICLVYKFGIGNCALEIFILR